VAVVFTGLYMADIDLLSVCDSIWNGHDIRIVQVLLLFIKKIQS
jgi:hypothetical protein